MSIIVYDKTKMIYPVHIKIEQATFDSCFTAGKVPERIDNLKHKKTVTVSSAPGKNRKNIVGEGID